MNKLKSEIRNPKSQILLIGYGNPGRLDDGLGPAFADAVAGMGISGVTVESNYQLTVEDAVEIAKHDSVIFVDADVNGTEPFYFRKIKPSDSISFTSHSISPESLLALAKEVYDAKTEAYILGIKGYKFNGFAEKLSDGAKKNLFEALKFIEKNLLHSSASNHK